MELTQKRVAVDENQILADDILAAYDEEPRLAKSLIEVVCQNGIVTLWGTVATEDAHRAAEEIAYRHAHVTSVVNGLEVYPEVRPMERVADAMIQMTRPAFCARLGPNG